MYAKSDIQNQYLNNLKDFSCRLEVNTGRSWGLPQLRLTTCNRNPQVPDSVG